MTFSINNVEWTISLVNKNDLLKLYKDNNDEDCNFAFGVCIYSEHRILINKNMCIEQQINTLKHELTHCYIFNYGLFNVPNFTEEMVCDLVSSIHNFISEVVDNFKKYY